MPGRPDLCSLSHGQKDALITALMAQVAALTARVAELEAKLWSAAEDARQFQPSALERPEGVGARETEGQSRSARGRPSPAPSQPDARADRVGVRPPGLRRRRFERGAERGSRLRPHRNSRGQARRDARDAQGRRLSLLRQTLQGGGARGPLAGFPPGSQSIGANISGPCIGRRVFFGEARADDGEEPPSGLAGGRRSARA